MANNTVRHINIIGHQNPDTDSICSALAYAWLKNRGSLTGLYEARRAGHVNRETRFVLQHFGVEAPRLCTDVSPQIKDIDIRDAISELGQDYRFEESPSPIPALRSRKKDNTTLGRTKGEGK